MGRKCCVMNCNGNYDAANKESTFRLPADEDERARWLASIPRDNIPNSKDTVVCARHWPPNYAEVTIRGKKRPKDPPSVFDCVKQSCRPTAPPPPRPTIKALSASRQIEIDPIKDFEEIDVIKQFDEIKQKIHDKFSKANISIIQNTEALITFQSLEYVLDTGIPRFSLTIKQDFTYEAYHSGIRCNIASLSKNRITSLNRWSRIEESFRFLQSCEFSHKTNILSEQTRAMSCKPVCQKKYEPATLVRAFEYYTLSRSAYNRMRTDFELPSVRTLTKLTSKVRNLDDTDYLSAFFSGIPENQKNCLLLLDEVYVKPSLQYHGGAVFGKAVNRPDLLANTVLSFMIVCLFNGPKLLYRMLPVKQLDSVFLYEQTNLILKLISQAGGIVKAIICDNNRVNQSFFKMFNGNVPWQSKDNVFLLFDFVHLIKSVRNNWITEKTKKLIFYEDNEPKVASWSHLENLLRYEKQNIVKMSNLTDVAVYPSPVERQKVSFCLKVFCDRTLSALRCHPEMSNSNDTALFIDKVLRFWKIMNVKCPFENIRMKDECREAIRTKDAPSLLYLLEFGDMALKMTAVGTPRNKCLTKDTAQAIWHTCNGMVGLTRHLLETTHQFVMLGVFTTDHLEKHFGKLRQGSGGTYFITIQQVMEKLAIHKAKILLRDIKNDVFQQSSSSAHLCEKCNFRLNEDMCSVFDNLPELEFSLTDDVKMSLVYIAGYISRHEDEAHEGAYAYYDHYGGYLKEHNRGGLKVPRDCICQWVMFAYIMFHGVANFTCRNSLCKLLELIADFYDLGVSPSYFSILANILLKNYCNLYSPRSSKEPQQKLLKLSL